MLGIIKKLFGGGTPAPDFRELVQAGALILDVRTPGEYKSGHIRGAVNIPLDQVQGKIGELKKKNKTVITCCRSGARSGAAARMLKSAGLTCYNGGPWNLLERKIK